MKKTLLIKTITFLILFYCSILNAQWQNGLWIGKEAYNWYFGNQAGLNFNSFPPTALTDGQTSDITGDIIEGAGTISDANGNLLFYTNGDTVWNKNHEVMENGQGLFGDTSSTQSGLIIPKPGTSGIYYIFSIIVELQGYEGLYFSEVDMSLNNGLGAITENKNILLTSDVNEKMSATYHFDKEKIWVLVHKSATNSFVAFEVSNNGINMTPVISEIGDVIDLYTVGQMKISPNGKKIAICYAGFSDQKGVRIFNFNNQTGEVYNLIASLDNFDVGGDLIGAYGAEFSPNSNLLYISALFTGKLFQFDLTTENEDDIKQSGINLGDGNNGGAFFASLQAGPDGKIYLAKLEMNLPEFPVGSTLDVINYPNNTGSSSGYLANSISLMDRASHYSLPGFIQSYFASGILYEGDVCQGNEIIFSTLRIPDIESISWNFGDPASGAANISDQPVHAFSGPGTYTVTATITSNGAIQMATTEVVIIEGPKAVAPAAELLVKCADENGTAVFDLSAFNATILNGQDTDIFSLAYYATDADRVANTPIADLSNFTTAGQTIYVVVSNSETGCTTILPLTFIVNPLPVVTVPATEQCGDLAGNSVFNLKNQDAVILNGQNTADFTIAYYTDEAMANAIGQPESFTSAGQTIYAEVTNSATGCSSSVAFNVVVTEVDLIGAELIVEGCSPFNLTTILTQIPTGVTFNFYSTEQDALNETNAITDTESFMPGVGIDKIYVIATSAEGCQSVNELQLKYLGCVIPRGISPNGDGMNDTFDLSAFDIKTLKIFNRYGKEVYTKDNYTDQFNGQGTHGHDLPTGTYYYMIQLGSGEQKTGWVYLNLEAK